MTPRRAAQAAALLLLLLAGCPRGGDGPLAARVDGQPITWNEVDMEARLALMPGREIDAAARQAALEDLIDQSLLLSQARRLNARVDPGALDQARQLARAGLSQQELEASLLRRGVSRAYYDARLERQALADEAVRLKIRSQLVIRREDLKGYYWEHVTDFRRPESVHLLQVYTSRRSDAEKALAEIRLGEPFAAVAQKYSKGPEAARGGDLGWVSRNNLPKVLREAAFKLKAGGVSPVLASPFGYHILKAEEARKARTLSLDEAAPEIHAELLKRREQPLYRDWLFLLRQSLPIQRFDDPRGTPKPEQPRKKEK